MSYYQKFVTTLTGKMSVLLLTAGLFTVTSMAADRLNFPGYGLYESKSELGHFGFGNKVCLDYLANQMRSKTMKITGQADILIVHLASSSPEVTLVTRQEKLTFDGKKSEATLFTGINKKSTVKWSDD